MSFQPPTAASLRTTKAVTPAAINDLPDGEIAFDPSKFVFVHDEDERSDGDMELYAVRIDCDACGDWEYEPHDGESLFEVLQAALIHQQMRHKHG